MSEPIQLSTRQQALYEAIANRSGPLAQIYLGMIRVVADDSNPDRFALAAHGVREMMDLLPRYLNLAVKFSDERLSDKINGLEVVWENTVSNSACLTSIGWAGTIDTHLRKFIVKFEEFLKWDKEHHPKRVSAARRVFRTFDVMPLPLPPPLEDRRVKEWSALHDYFTNVLHHSSQPRPDEFMQGVEDFETFLLDRLRPQPFEDVAVIDALIREGEMHD